MQTSENPKQSRLHILNLTYADYLKSAGSIANSQIGRYLVYDELGRGAFGTVYRGMDDQTKRTVAIKVLDLQAVERQPDQTVRTIRRRLCISQPFLMMLCESQNVVKCFDVFENRWLKIMVMEFCNGGDLHDQIAKKGRIPQNEAILILKQLINGIAELHTHGIIHRDLKAENILSHNGIYKIADLGLSKQVDDDQANRTTLGTITTMAPQVMKRQPYGLKADIWSLGIIFFQMVFGKVPYTSTTALMMCQQIQTKKILDSQQFQYNNYKASKEVTKFLREVICVDKTQRLGWKDLIDHEIFKLERQSLDSQFRLDYQLKKPQTQIIEAAENNKCQQIYSFHLETNLLESSQDKKEHQLFRLTYEQASQKMKEVVKDQDQLYSWVVETHFECLKTQLIYNQIFEIIESHKLLELNDRKVVEFMYLILTRCLNNISVINDKMKHQNPALILTKLQENVQSLYEKITNAWKKYAAILTDVQNKFGSILGDGLLKIFKSKSIQMKDKFLIGIQKMYYTKQQQIEFTHEEYIKQLSRELKQKQVEVVKKLKKYLSHYVDINSIKLGELKQRSFDDYVEMILQ